MKKGILAIFTVFLFGIAIVGCATQGDLAKMKAQEQQTDLKADQALKASQEANEAAMKASQASDQKADQALKAAQEANEAAKLAEERAQAAEARAQEAEAKAEKTKADAAFAQSMQK
jgi:hypothetical protein